MTQIKRTILSISLLLLVQGCQRHNTTVLGNQSASQKLLSPLQENKIRTIAIYQRTQKPHNAYRIIGKTSIARKDILGIERKPSMIMKLMQKKAHKLGGDGVIDIKVNNNTIDANVISYEKILI